jgi:DNA polymerase (family 10)
VTPSDLTHILDELGALAEIRGAPSMSADLRRAAAALGRLDSHGFATLLQRAKSQRLVQEPGISPTLHWRLHEIARGGGQTALRAARAGVPLLFQRLFRLPAATTADALALVRQLGVLTLSDLGVALDDGRVQAVLGEAAHHRLRAAALALEMEVQPLPLGRGWDLLDRFMAAVAAACPRVDGLVAAGDVRRCEALVASLAVVGRAADPAEAIDAICALPGLDDVRHRGGRRTVVVIRQAEIDVRIAAPEEYGTVLFRATGPRPHVAAVHRRRPVPLSSREEEVYAYAGLAPVPAELRQDGSEVEIAASGTLPALVTREDIRGDLHMHTTYSDGRDPLDLMVAECGALGYEYIAITDHSERAAASRTVDADQLARQADEIARVRERHPGLAILHGIEVDIMPDGSLDFPDAVLERLDIVLASLHERAGQDDATLTRRYLRAIRHPLVNIITHPSNRLVGSRPGYDLAFERLFEAAVETGTALEIDGAPAHLDMDGEVARRAVASGVTVAIDSDCHRARSLDRQMRMGIGTARRGWVEPRHVLNARPLAEVRAFVAVKRAGRW